MRERRPAKLRKNWTAQREQHGPARAQHELGDAVAPGQVGVRGRSRHHDPAEAEPAEVREVDLALVQPADGDQHAAEADQDQAAASNPRRLPEDARGVVLGEQRRLQPQLDRATGRRRGLARSPTLSSGMADDAQVEDVARAGRAAPAAASSSCGRRAVAGHRLDHPAAAVDQGAVEVHLQVAAGALDVEREQLVRQRRLGEAEARPGTRPARRTPDWSLPSRRAG